MFGDIKPGSAVAVGPAISQTFANGGYAQLKGVYSIRRFRLLQARYDTQRFWRGRALLSSRVRWQDAPKLPLYGLGSDSPALRAKYDERKTSLNTALTMRLSPMFEIAAGAGVERYALSGGSIDSEDESLAAIPSVAGLAEHLWFLHTFVSAALNTHPGTYSRSGTEVDLALHDYRDRHDGAFSFARLEAGARRLVPFSSRSGVELSARTWISATASGRSVPFFLMPTLGGGGTLEAFDLYRFRDRDAILLKGEYRRAVHDMIDVAAFYEAGTVAPAPRAFSLRRAAQSAGAGVIVHTPAAEVMRLDIAFGREGAGIAILFNVWGS